MGLEFTLALIVASIVFILTISFGGKFKAWIKTVGLIIVITPIAFYFIVGYLGMLDTDPETARAIADTTIAKITEYVSNQLHSIVISDIAGAVVGAVGGFIVKIVKNR